MSRFTHPAEGRLRRLLDEPMLVPDRQRFHVAGCPHCGARLQSLRADRDLVGTSLLRSVGNPRLTAAQARGRLAAAMGAMSDTRSLDPGRGLPSRPSLLRAKRWAAGGAGALVIVAGTISASAAAGWITIFQPAQVLAVPIPQGALLRLPKLGDFGRLSGPGVPKLTLVSSLAAAEARSGERLSLPASPPPGAAGAPRFAVVPKWSATFTFSAAQTRATAERLGVSLPPLPSGFDGAKLREVVGPAALAVYPSTSGAGLAALPQAAYLAMAAPELESSRLTVSQLERYLLSLPWLPSSLARAIRTLGDPAATLPIPVPQRMGQTRNTTVNGDSAVLVSGSGGAIRVCHQAAAAGSRRAAPRCHGSAGAYAAVVWEHRGTVRAVFAQLPADQVLAMARG